MKENKNLHMQQSWREKKFIEYKQRSLITFLCKALTKHKNKEGV